MIYLSYWSKTKKKGKRYYRRARRFNRRNKIVGLHYDNLVSPVDFTPAGWINKGRKGYKYGKAGYQLTKRGMSGYGRTAYKSASLKFADATGSLVSKSRDRYNSKKKPSRRSSSPNRRNSQSRRGGSSRYYYYRGKRYERKYRR